jgi:hypothetical protein
MDLRAEQVPGLIERGVIERGVRDVCGGFPVASRECGKPVPHGRLSRLPDVLRDAAVVDVLLLPAPYDFGAGQRLLQQLVAPGCAQRDVDAPEIRLVAAVMLHDFQAGSQSEVPC